MTALYEDDGVRFQYPENWSLAERSDAWPREVTVESPTGAFWTLQIYAHPRDPEHLVDEVVRIMDSDCEQLEAEPVRESFGSVVAEGRDMAFFLREFVITCRVRAFTVQDRSYLVLAQAEDRDFERLETVFQAMTVSLLRNLEL